MRLDAQTYGRHAEFAYHYTTREAAFEHILPTGRLRLSSFAQMRDPVENKEWAQVLIAEGKDAEEQLKTLERLALHAINETKLLSFTLDAPEPTGLEGHEHARGYARPRMWEQYAENHSGVCLLFDRQRLRDVLMDVLPAFNDVTSGEVRYANMPAKEREAARILNVDHLRAAGGGDFVPGLRSHIRDYADELFFRKLEDWQAEYEYRFVLFDEDTYIVYAPYKDSLRAVVLGERFPDWQLAGAVEACTCQRVDLRKMEFGPFPPGVFDPVARRASDP